MICKTSQTHPPMQGELGEAITLEDFLNGSGFQVHSQSPGSAELLTSPMFLKLRSWISTIGN
jgi:hypothetical protein